jgi:antirestriction protein ArdC
MSTYQEITNTIIEALEKGVLPWSKDWSGSSLTRPTNPITKKSYNGINILLLWISGQKNSFGTQKWATFKQISEAGGKVKKGSKGTVITFFKTLKIAEKNTDTEETEDKFIPMLKTHVVFNLAQTEGLEDLLEVKTFDTTPEQRLEAYIKSTTAHVEITGFQPLYNITSDKIEMPEIKYFKTQQGYYAAMLHELSHWTGHTSRLDRFNDARTKQNYAFEELIAELSAAYLCSDLGIEYAIEKHASYIDAWLKVLKSDCKAIFNASSKASKASEYLNNLQANKQIAKLA